MTSLSYSGSAAASAERSRQRFRQNGCTPSGSKLWSEDENAIGRMYHPDYLKITNTLQGRSLRAVRTQCQKLGIAIRRHICTSHEIARLRRLYPSADWQTLHLEFPFASQRMISVTSTRHCFYRDKKPYVKTGIKAVDEIRDRCFEIPYSMPDLDDVSQTKIFYPR